MKELPNESKTETVELSDEELEQVSGGLLLPAVQKVRDAAGTTSDHDEWVEIIAFSQRIEVSSSSQGFIQKK